MKPEKNAQKTVYEDIAELFSVSSNNMVTRTHYSDQGTCQRPQIPALILPLTVFPITLGKQERQKFRIRQEFDNVAGLLSDKVYYDENGKLVSRGRYYYREDRMLYQILTRARHKIHLVVFNNPVMLERCIKLMNK